MKTTQRGSEDRRTAEARRRRERLVGEFGRTGATQAAFCRKHGLDGRTFNGWLRKARAAAPAFARVELPAAAPSGWSVEVALANGARIRVVGSGDVGGVAALVREVVR